MPAAGVEIKTSTMHVEAAIRVISGRGFNSPRLQIIGQKNPGFAGVLLFHRAETFRFLEDPPRTR